MKPFAEISGFFSKDEQAWFLQDGWLFKEFYDADILAGNDTGKPWCSFVLRSTNEKDQTFNGSGIDRSPSD